MTIAPGLDHVVVVVPDLDDAIAAFERAGFLIATRGRHEKGGAENALIPLADGCSLELFSFFEERPEHSLWPVYARGGGLGQFWLCTDEIERDAARLRSLGAPLGPVRKGARRRDDGYEVVFEISTVRADEGFFAPCLIQDVTPKSERLPAALDHPNGVVGVDSLTIVLEDASDAMSFYSGLTGSEPKPIADNALDAEIARFRSGPHAIRIAQSRSGPESLARLRGAAAFGPAALDLSTVKAPLQLTLPGAGNGISLVSAEKVAEGGRNAG